MDVKGGYIRLAELDCRTQKTTEYFDLLLYHPESCQLFVGVYFSPGMYDREPAGYESIKPLTEYPGYKEAVEKLFRKAFKPGSVD